MTPRTSPHVESPHTTLDHLATLTQSRITRDRLRIPCPAHGGTNSNLALWVNQGGIAARCHSAGCSYADIAKAIENRYGISINPRHTTTTPTTPRPTNARRTPGPGPNAQDLRPHAMKPLAPLSPHPQVIRPPRQEVARQPQSVAPRAASPRASALDQRRTP